MFDFKKLVLFFDDFSKTIFEIIYFSFHKINKPEKD